MSLLIDALKRAERVKSGQAEPGLAQPSSIERAIEAESKPLDWTLAESVSDPAVGDAATEPAEIASRTEPTFSAPAAAPTAPPASGAIKAVGSTDNVDVQRKAKEREAAQTLFQAKRLARRSRAGVLLVGGVAALLLAAGGFYVWYSLAFPPTPPYQPVQAHIPAPAPIVNKPTPVASAEPVSPSLATAQPSPSTVMDPAPKAEATPIPEVGDEGMRKTKRSLRSASDPVSTQTDSAVEQSSEATVRREIEQARRTRSPRPNRTDDSTISVNRGDHGSDFDPDLALAYNSLLSGQRAEAKRLYSIVAERDPLNVDALLGLATIAANQGDLNGAERYYRRALELEPQNPAALAGLASIRQPGGPSESQINFELARSPDSPQLHFALGNQYANQGRWDEAQQAYFDAFSLDAGNPDYAYNLAVSLDQLGQSKHATTYYRKALELSKQRSARFRSTDVASRLSELAATQ